MTLIKKTDYTNLGFSKTFSCCGHHTVCDFGKGACYYAEIAPEVQKSCRVWNRHHLKAEQIVEGKMETKTPISAEPQLPEQQLSLFD